MSGRLFSLVLVLGLIGNVTVVRATVWTSAAGDGDWMNEGNWNGGLPVAGERVEIESATPLLWPTLDGGVASCGQLRLAYSASTVGELTVTGGATLNVGGELRLGRKDSDPLPAGYLYISGADTRILVADLIECGRYGIGVIDMSGGYLHSDAQLRMAHRDGSSGTVYLRGGTIDLAGDPGITVTAGGETSSGLIDLSGDGTLILAGNQVALAETLVSDGIIIAYNGESLVSITYDAQTDVTTIVAVSPERASDPSPAHEATDVPWDAVLSWTPGRSADQHDVYLGTSLEDVNNASPDAGPAGVYMGRQGLDFFTVGRFELGRTYYWRVDEVTAAPGSRVLKGHVWQFTVEPLARPLPGVSIIATASSSNSTAEGPENTVNGSGLDANDLHATKVTDMWLSDAAAEGPPWIQYEFDKLYALHQMLVWNHNSGLEAGVGLGAKNVTIEYSVNGAEWRSLDTTHEMARASGVAGYAANTTVDFQGVAAKYVKITIDSNWGGILSQFGLSEVRFLYLPLSARQPDPSSGATGVALDVVLTWQAGREATSHDVYLSQDMAAVADGTALMDAVSETSYDLEPFSLQLGRTYYWKINEVNEAETPAIWEGDLWSFTIVDFVVVDDFESYTDNIEAGEAVFDTWLDGWEIDENGSQVGYAEAPFTEQTIVNSGAQSMPLFYDNTLATYSEAERTFDRAQDWTANGIAQLSLWYYGAGSVASVDYDDAAGTYTLVGGGDDNIGGGDQVESFTFAHVTLTGDGTITAKVESVTQATDTGRAGVMIRDTLDADSAYVSENCNPTGGVFQNLRVAVGEDSVNDRVDHPLPRWIRIERIANNFTTLHSADGQAWEQHASVQNVFMDGPVYIGLVATTSQGRIAPNTAVFSNVSVTGNVSGTTFTTFADVTDDILNLPERLYVTMTDVGNRTAQVEISADGAPDNQWNEGLVDLTALPDPVDLSAVKALTIGVGDGAAGSSGLIYIDDVRLYPARAQQ